MQFSSYGRRVSGASENRAAVFTGQPQDVEVYRDGSWWPGSLLGWRHDLDGGCQAWVRVMARGVEDSTWLALDYLRLPEPVTQARADRHLPVVEAALPVRGAEWSDDSALTGTMAAIRAVPAPRGRRSGPRERASELTATMNVLAVRDRSAETVSSVAPAVPEPRPAGGRRRAPETVEPNRSAARPAVAASTPGRHRAPAPAAGAAGRHRAADTGVWPAVRDDRAEVTELPRPSSSVPVPDGPDAHLLTRPMRLGDLLDGGAPQPRPARRDGRLSV